MGCTSSIQTKKDNSITGENSKNEMAVDEDTKSPTDNLHSGLPESKLTGNLFLAINLRHKVSISL